MSHACIPPISSNFSRAPIFPISILRSLCLMLFTSHDPHPTSRLPRPKPPRPTPHTSWTSRVINRVLIPNAPYARIFIPRYSRTETSCPTHYFPISHIPRPMPHKLTSHCPISEIKTTNPPHVSWSTPHVPICHAPGLSRLINLILNPHAPRPMPPELYVSYQLRPKYPILIARVSRLYVPCSPLPMPCDLHPSLLVSQTPCPISHSPHVMYLTSSAFLTSTTTFTTSSWCYLHPKKSTYP